MPKILERLLSLFHYVLGAFLVLSGVVTAFTAPVVDSAGGFIYSSTLLLIFLGFWIGLAGLVLLVGKFKRNHATVGLGLFWSALVFVFSAIINIIVFGFAWPTWGGNIIAAATVGVVWIYHKSQRSDLR